MRSTTHRPAGTSQSSAPSLPIFAVRSTTLLFAIAWSGGTVGVPAVLGSVSVAKLALSSHMFTRGPESSSISAISNCRNGGNERRPASGLGGGAWKTTRYQRAVVGGKEEVRTGKPPKSGSGPGRLTRVTQLVPSWLA